MNSVSLILTIVLEEILIFVCVSLFFGKKFKLDKKVAGFIICVSLMFYLINIRVLHIAWMAVVYMLLFIFCILYFQKTIGKTIVLYLLSLSMLGVLEALGTCLVVIVQDKLGCKMNSLVASSVTAALVIVIYLFRYVLIKKSIAKNILFWTCIFSCVLALSGVIVNYNFYQSKINFTSVIIWGLGLGIFSFAFKLQKSEYEIKSKNNALKIQEVYTSAYAGLIDEVRKRQHDFKNQLGCVYSMHLLTQSYEELVNMQREYCGIIEENNKHISILTRCNNSILAGYIYEKCIHLENSGIDIEYKVNIDQAECNMPLYEIIEMLGIIINNAEEKVSALSRKYIGLYFTEYSDKVSFQVKNISEYIKSSEIEKFFMKGYSTKGKDRGLGLYRVKELVNNYKDEIYVNNIKEDNDYYFLIEVNLKKQGY